MPAAVAGSLIFAVVYVMLCKRTGCLLALLTASAIWFSISLPLAYSKFEDINTATIFFAFVWITSVYGMSRQKTRPNMPKKIRYTWIQKIGRAVFAGSVIAFSVVISSMMGPLWGGAFAAFPAMFLTTFLILYRSYGCEYSTELARNTPAGLLGVVPYLWGVHYFYPSHGLIGGTLISYALSLSMTIAAYWLMNPRGKKASHRRVP
jgi:hypothetical protein